MHHNGYLQRMWETQRIEWAKSIAKTLKIGARHEESSKRSRAETPSHQAQIFVAFPTFVATKIYEQPFFLMKWFDRFTRVNILLDKFTRVNIVV